MYVVSEMTRLEFTKQEVLEIKEKAYFTTEEEKILDMWLREETIVKMSSEMKMSVSSISRKKDKILKKIKRVI
jgi:hypothetical protein